MKKIIKYHSSYITNEIYDDFYMCPYCKEYVIRSHFDFCPICGEKIEFQTEKDYENELLNRIISRIKNKLYEYFILTKNEDGSYSLIAKNNEDAKDLSKKAKFVIKHILLSFTEKKVKTKHYHPMMFSDLNFEFANRAKYKAELIFKEFIKEYKEKLN